jgi:hypothetical protein
MVHCFASSAVDVLILQRDHARKRFENANSPRSIDIRCSDFLITDSELLTVEMIGCMAVSG